MLEYFIVIQNKWAGKHWWRMDGVPLLWKLE